MEQNFTFFFITLPFLTSKTRCLQSHYSILKAAHWLGIGCDNVYQVDCDAEGRMVPAHLETRIQEALAAGKRPFFVNTTAGTTVLGAFDPYPAIADVCVKYKLWLHIDVSLRACGLLT